MFTLKKIPAWVWAILAVVVFAVIYMRVSEGHTDQEREIADQDAADNTAVEEARSNDEEEETQVDEMDDLDSDEDDDF
jgi:type III secretory pathway component EscV